MHNLTTPIAVPNINRIEVVDVRIRGKISQIDISLEVLGVGGAKYPGIGPGVSPVFLLQIRNGLCSGLQPTLSPVGYDDRLELVYFSVPTGFEECASQYRLAGTDSAGRKNVETWLASKGLLPPGT